ncbi:sorting nexin-8 isoform X2 [Ooceraea biroi]|uniref:sorting nexin-8 isoform X2 n=1 Tax=Ooceraea biroi TaxID=2015173 RepID=UPI000F07E290|nr:sorting nexin-8 isoform X2 [Ooceraea biroi]
MASTDLSFGSIPAFYREVYEKICSPTSGNVKLEVFKSLLVKSRLNGSIVSQIWKLVDSKTGYLTRSGLYKGLALVAFAQQGKQPSDKLLENSESQELPVPALGDLSEVTLLAQRLHRGNPAKLSHTYSDICNLDTIEVNLVPEKKGIFLKHVEYQVTSKRFNSVVYRRYNDFVSLYDLLLARFPYRLIPKLPPKKIVGADSQFLEERRRSLLRFLTLIARHPVVSEDPIVQFFFTYTGDETQHKIREVFRRVPDEFATSELSSRAKELVPPETLTEFANSRDQIRVILLGISRLKHIADGLAIRSHNYAVDMAELGTQLNTLAAEQHGTGAWITSGSSLWQDMKKGFHAISKEFNLLSTRALQQAVREETMVCERLNLLLDILVAHRMLCERHERGVSADHQRALSTMLSLKKRQMQGVIRGTDADTVEYLENKMVSQESVIANVELRNCFSLLCMHMETQLVHAHLEILATVLQSLVSVQIRGHSEVNVIVQFHQSILSPCRTMSLYFSIDKHVRFAYAERRKKTLLAEVWKLIEPTITKYLPEKLASGSNGG